MNTLDIGKELVESALSKGYSKVDSACSYIVYSGGEDCLPERLQKKIDNVKMEDDCLVFSDKNNKSLFKIDWKTVRNFKINTFISTGFLYVSFTSRSGKGAEIEVSLSLTSKD